MNDIIDTTMIYLKKDDSYLLLFRNKKKNDINKGKWIGIGGHVEENETIDQCAIREGRGRDTTCSSVDFSDSLLILQYTVHMVNSLGV